MYKLQNMTKYTIIRGDNMKDIKLAVNKSKGYEDVVLPQVTTNEEGKKLVSGVELHEALGIKTPFKKWIDRMVEYGFIKDVDFTTIDIFVQRENSNLGNNKTDYILTLDMAKHISMIQRSEIGMKIRNYFIECEKELTKTKMDSYMIENPIERAKRWIEEQEEKQRLELENKEMKPMVESFNIYLNTEGTTTVTEACKRFGLKRTTVFERLRNNGLVYKNKVEATVKGIEKGYFKHVVKNGYPTMVVLSKGVEYIKTLKDTPLLENGVKKLKCWGEC